MSLVIVFVVLLDLHLFLISVSLLMSTVCTLIVLADVVNAVMDSMWIFKASVNLLLNTVMLLIVWEDAHSVTLVMYCKITNAIDYSHSVLYTPRLANCVYSVALISLFKQANADAYPTASS